MSASRESVWDYPRPPAVEPVSSRIRVYFAGLPIADTTGAVRVLETSHPPTYYIPKRDVETDFLEEHSKVTFCEWKGRARYYTVKKGSKEAPAAAWEYPEPNPGYRGLRGMLSFYAGAMERCYVGEELVDPQLGTFYGGWITSTIDGPFKGGPGTSGW